ncbi:MAG: DUF2141 domain-containing protein [Ignavibacteriales bacterium]|nr:DUF2141 domain-containing protein [Ignavibacteriales bacterium]
MNAFSQTQTNGRDTLTISAGNFSSDSGRAVVRLFRKEDDLPTKAFMEATSNIINGKSVLTFADIPYGEYAAIVFHDENSNGTLDHNFLGLPKEPMGFSNSWKLTIFSGMPSFSKLKFEFSEERPEYKIDIE